MKHGHSSPKKTPTYLSWRSMFARCYRPKCNGFENYGGRGISVCARWSDFRNFLADMGERPKASSIERINRDGHYMPSNCRWATDIEQHSNRNDNVLITFEGETKTMAQWAKDKGIDLRTLFWRLKKWNIETALGKPIRPKAREIRAS